MDRLRLLSINIWNRQGPWEQRLPLLRAGIAALTPDLIGLQEVLQLVDSGGGGDASNQALEIAAGLDGAYPHACYGAAWDFGGGPMTFGNALLSRWPIVEHQVLPLPVPEQDQGRSLLYALIDAPCGRVPVFVTHLTWQLYATHTRCEQVRRIDDHARALVAKDAFPAVLLGDLNAEPDADEVRFLRGLTPLGGRGTFWNDCWGAAGDGTAGSTYDRANAYALRTREPSRRIDYILARGPDRALRGEPLACRVVLTEATDGVWPSDHYGVYAEIQAAPRSGVGA